MNNIKLTDIKVGDTLTLEEIDNPSNVLKEKVTHIKNPDSEDLYFSIRTENRTYDFLNFYTIKSIN